jgi:hypothetical protein
MCLVLPERYVFQNIPAHGKRLPLAVGSFDIELIDRSHPARASIQQFIADRFRAQYAADLQHFCDVLIGSRGADGRWVAAVGLSHLASMQAFLEQYLERSVEEEISLRQADTNESLLVCRSEIVEFGNLAATQPGASRALILKLAPFLRAQKIRWVTFTGPRSLFNSFIKFNYKPVVITTADPARLRGNRNIWGSYYESSPKVMFGDVNAAYSNFDYAPY